MAIKTYVQIDEICDSIQNELIRLHCDADTDAYSGLMVAGTCLGWDDEPIVRLYDDQAEGYYRGGALLNGLKAIATASLESDLNSDINIWALIREFEQ